MPFPAPPPCFTVTRPAWKAARIPLTAARFHWGREDAVLLHHYRTLGRLRSTRLSPQKGAIEYLRAEGGLLVFLRRWENEVTLAALNNGPAAQALELPWAVPWP